MWCWRHSFRIVSCESPKTMRKLYLSIKLPHREIRSNYGIFRSDHNRCLIGPKHSSDILLKNGSTMFSRIFPEILREAIHENSLSENYGFVRTKYFVFYEQFMPFWIFGIMDISYWCDRTLHILQFEEFS